MRGLQRAEDNRERNIRLAEDILIPNPHYANPQLLQRSLACRVRFCARWVVVDRPVYLNGEPGGVAVEVGRVGTDGVLASEFEVHKPAVSKQRP